MKSIEILITIFFLIICSFFKFFSYFFKIKFGTVDFARIGGIYVLDWYISEKKEYKNRSLDIFFYTDPNRQTNKQWLKMWKKNVFLFCVPHIFIRSINRVKKYKFLNNIIDNIPVNLKYPELSLFFKTKSKSLIKNHNHRLKIVLNDKKPNISFTSEEIQKGKEFLEKIGVNNNQYICINNRDNKYLNTRFKNSDWEYHDYRNFVIEDYEETVNFLIDKGFFVIRLGSEVEGHLNINSKKYFDYSLSDYQSDFLDIYLSSKCYFFISSDSGISAIPEIFKVPVVYINKSFLNEIHRWNSKCLFIFKKFYSKKFKRYLNFDEVWKLKFGDFEHDKNMVENQIAIQNNTPKEIKKVTEEMLNFLEKKLKYTEQDELIQNKFWKIFAPNNLRSNFCRIGRDYLYENKSLL